MKLVTILSYINEEIHSPVSNAVRLHEILHYPWFNIPSIDLARIALAKRDEKIKNWRLWLQDDSFLTQIPFQAPEELGTASALIEDWIASGVNHTIQELFEKIIYSRPIFNYISTSDEPLFYLQVTNTFFSFMKDQMDKHQRLTLAEFLSILDRMNKNKVELPLSRIDKSGEGIQLMTAHGSKGLEFEHVIIMGAERGKWEKSRAINTKFVYPENLVPKLKENKLEDERRLFYVSLTRAKREVLITYSHNALNGKSQQPSQFVEEIRAGGHTRPWHHEASEKEKVDFLFSQYAPNPGIKDAIPPQIDEALELLTLNISGVNKYLNCPITYYYENILRAPLGRSAPMGYGHAVHEALERSFRHEDNTVGSFPAWKTMLFYFEKGMERFHSHFTATEYENYLNNGQIKLEAYYNYHIEEWKLLDQSSAEKKIKNIHIDGIPVSGIFDRTDIIDEKLIVVDYKTGSSKRGLNKLKPPAENADELNIAIANNTDPDIRHDLLYKIRGGDYWRQLVFYKLMADADPQNKYPFHSTYISFVESDDNPGLYRQPLHINPKDERVVKEQLRDVYERIKNKEFDNGCRRSTCRWCNLLGNSG